MKAMARGGAAQSRRPAIAENDTTCIEEVTEDQLSDRAAAAPPSRHAWCNNPNCDSFASRIWQYCHAACNNFSRPQRPPCRRSSVAYLGYSCILLCVVTAREQRPVVFSCVLPATLAASPMQCFERAAARDAIVVVAWAVVTAWLRLASAASRLGRRFGLSEPQPGPGPADPVPEGVRTLERMAERSVWRSETLAALHADALALLARADADYAHALEQLSSLRNAPALQEETPQSAGDAPLAA
jgi:hypothetical protein